MNDIFSYGYHGDDIYEIPENVDWEKMIADESQRDKVPEKVREKEEAAHRKLEWLKEEIAVHTVALRKLQQVKLRYEKSDVPGKMLPYCSSAYGISDEELIYAFKLLMTVTGTVKAVFQQTALKFDRPSGWVERVLKYRPRKDQFARVLNKLYEEASDFLDNLKKYKLYNFKLWLKSGSISSFFTQVKKAQSLMQLIKEKDDEILNLNQSIRERDRRMKLLLNEKDAKLQISKVEEAKHLKMHNPKMSYSEIGKRIGVTRQTAADYCRR